MKTNITKQKLANQQTVFGIVVRFHSAAVVEMFGLLGFDFVMIDCEHGDLSLQSSQDLVRAAEATGMNAIVRVPYLHVQTISRTLDAGAHGVQVPMVNSKEDAETVVKATKYYPTGERGVAMARSGDYGMTMPLAEYVQRANEETMIVAHIESVKAIENLPEILKVDGIDVYFLGPSDLSQSLGIPGQNSHPKLVGAIEYAIKTIQDAGKVAGIYASNAADICKYRDMGVKYLFISADNLIRKAGLEFLQQVRQQ